MADFVDSFETWLRSRPRITDLVGENAAARIYPDVPKQGIQLPFVVYDETGGESDEHLTGGSGIVRAMLNVWTFGDTRRKANELAEIIKEDLRPFRGMMFGTNVNEVSCSSHRSSGVDLPQDGSDAKRYWTRRVFDIWHTETT